jgi:hypothetical protein
MSESDRAPLNLDNAGLKAYLFEAMRGPGGVPDFFLALRDLMCEMAKDQEKVVQDEHITLAWKSLVRYADLAYKNSLPLLRIED